MKRSNYTHGTATSIKMPRTRFPVNHTNITTAKVGYLYPIYCQEIYPGDTFNISTNWVARSVVPFFRPVMDNLFVDFMYFFVPSRLCYADWEKIFGESSDSSWIDQEVVEAPASDVMMTVTSRSVADYLGLPPGRVPKGLNMIPLRAFAKIYNEWFRDQNLIDETYVQTGTFNNSGERLNGNAWSPANYTGLPPKVAKFHDYFTGALKAPQKGDPVEVPISGGVLPVKTFEDLDSGNTSVPLRMGLTGAPNVSSNSFYNLSLKTLSPTFYGSRMNLQVNPVESDTSPDAVYKSNVYPTNLGVDASQVGMVTVNTLRLAFQTQKILERSARGGTRYREYLRSAFGCVSSDARMQIPEFLGGKRMPLNVQQATSTQSGDNLGDVAGWSLSNGRNGYLKGFVEHGFVIGVMCIRHKHTYSQGIERFWSRKGRWDYYDPTLAHIGETPIYESEICVAVEENLKGNVFGYREAFSDLRYRPNLVTGQARPQQNSSNFFYYTFADDYQLIPSTIPGQLPQGAPVLSEEFINETDEYVRRSMSGITEEDDQFIFDINFSGSAIRVLPAHGTPSLIDHY